MSDLIDRQAAIDALCDNCNHVQAVCPHYPCKQYTSIERLPSATQTNDSNTLNAMDCISRQAAIDALMTILDKPNHAEFLYTDEICKVLNELPPVQPEPRWIPVTERLSEDGQRVLVTYDLVKGYPWVNILRYGKPMSEDKPCFYEVDSEWGYVPYEGIVAWMPLPEPYKEEKANEKD